MKRLSSYLVLLSLLGCAVGDRLPHPSTSTQFSYTVALREGGEAQVFVDRPGKRVAIRAERYGFIGQIPNANLMATRGTLLDHQEKVYVKADPAETRQRAMAEEIWRTLQRDELLRVLGETLWSSDSQFLSGKTFDVRPGGEFEGEKTSQVVLWSRKNLGDSRIQLPFGAKQDGAAFNTVPHLGLVLEGGFSGARVTSLKVGSVEPSVFEVPEKFKEKWDDQELEEVKIKTPFDKKAPKDYVHIGGDWFRELDWQGQQISVSWQKWMQEVKADLWSRCFCIVFPKRTLG